MNNPKSRIFPVIFTSLVDRDPDLAVIEDRLGCGTLTVDGLKLYVANTEIINSVKQKLPHRAFYSGRCCFAYAVTSGPQEPDLRYTLSKTPNCRVHAPCVELKMPMRKWRSLLGCICGRDKCEFSQLPELLLDV